MYDITWESIIYQQRILMKYHALFVIFEKSGKIYNCILLQIIGGALREQPRSMNCWAITGYL